MKIPIIQAEKRLPVGEVVRPVGLMAEAGASQQVQGLINSIVEEESKLREQQRKVQLQKDYDLAEMDVESENVDLVNRLRTDPNIINNPITYFGEWQKGFEGILKKRINQISLLSFMDKDTHKKIEDALKKRIQLREVIEQKNYGQGLWIHYQQATDTKLLDYYTKNGEIDKGIALLERQIGNGVYRIDIGENKINEFRDKTEKQQKENNYANALNMIMIDPTEETLNKAIKLFDIPTEKQPDLRRQQRIERDAQEKQKKEIETLAHDDKEREVEKLIRKGKLNEAFVASGSNLLKADEQAKWRKDIETVSKQSDDKINPDVENAEIVRINRLISYKADPNKIRREILTSEMTKQNKEQRLINLETKLVHEMDEGRRRGYQDIQDIIIPPKVGLSITNLLQSPKATMAIKNAQIALDDWIQNQIINKKEPSINEIRIKAQQLAQSFAIPMSEAMIDLEEEAKKAAEETKKYGEQKIKKSK